MLPLLKSLATYSTYYQMKLESRKMSMMQLKEYVMKNDGSVERLLGWNGFLTWCLLFLFVLFDVNLELINLLFH